MSTINIFFQSLLAENYKIKRSPALWISRIAGIFMAFFTFLNFALDSMDQVVPIGENPWTRYTKMCLHIIAIFIVPFLLILCSALFHFEHSNNSWKKLYSLPVKKSVLYFSKLTLLLLLLLLLYTLFTFSTFLFAYILTAIKPVFEFHQYEPNISIWFEIIPHAFIASLGVIGFQYWLSQRWSNFIIPIGIGLLGFIIGLILLNQSELIVYFPHAYPSMMLLKYGLYQGILGLNEMGPLANIEWFSLACFIFFIALGYWEEKRKSIVN